MPASPNFSHKAVIQAANFMGAYTAPIASGEIKTFHYPSRPYLTVSLRSKGVTSSEDVPAWRQKIKMHVNATGNYAVMYDSSKLVPCVGTRHYETFNITVGKYLPTDATFGGQLFRDVPVSALSTSGIATAAMNRCISDFREKARQRSFQSMAFLGELRETVRMLRNPFEGVRNLAFDTIRSAKKRTKRMNRRQAIKAISDGYLEFKFGVQPLLEDTKGAYAAIRQVAAAGDERYAYIRSFGAASLSDQTYGGTTKLSFGDGGNPVGYMRSISLTREYRAIMRGVVLLSNASANKADASLEAFGLTLGDAVPAAWELVPYSFLVDYFTNVGDLLQQAFGRDGNMAWSNTATILRDYGIMTGYITRPNGTLSAAYRCGGEAGMNERQRTTFSRSPGTNEYIRFQLRLPGVMQNLNVAALLTSFGSEYSLTRESIISRYHKRR